MIKMTSGMTRSCQDKDSLFATLEFACVQHSDQLSADMCSHEQLVRLMQWDSASYGSSVQQVLPYVPKKNPNIFTKVMIHRLFKLHHRQSLHCNASLWREPLPFLFWRPPDAPLLRLKTQPSLLHCSSWMRSCILSSGTSQAHTCPTATLTRLGRGEVFGVHLCHILQCLVWILKLCDYPFVLSWSPTWQKTCSPLSKAQWIAKRIMCQ